MAVEVTHADLPQPATDGGGLQLAFGRRIVLLLNPLSRERTTSAPAISMGTFSRSRRNTPSTGTQTQTIFLVLTLFLKPNLSLSISGGPQHYSSTQALSPSVAAWQPMTIVSMGWQGQRTTVAASYSRTVSGGGGLNGTFHTNAANASFSWQISPELDGGSFRETTRTIKT